MSVSLWAYNPDVCDGDFCPMDCDYCPKREMALEAASDEASDPDEPIDLEMGFDPYLGCYTGDC